MDMQLAQEAAYAKLARDISNEVLDLSICMICDLIVGVNIFFYLHISIDDQDAFF